MISLLLQTGIAKRKKKNKNIKGIKKESKIWEYLKEISVD